MGVRLIPFILLISHYVDGASSFGIGWYTKLNTSGGLCQPTSWGLWAWHRSRRRGEEPEETSIGVDRKEEGQRILESALVWPTPNVTLLYASKLFNLNYQKWSWSVRKDPWESFCINVPKSLVHTWERKIIAHTGK